MDKREDYVFFSVTRWPVVVKASIFLFTFIFVFLLAALWGFLKTPLDGRKLPTGENEIVDEISTRIEDKILVSGHGPIVSLSGVETGTYNLVLSGDDLDEKNAILTFDDGPDPLYTPEILDILDREGIKATFFVLGSKVVAHPEIAREIIERGHTIGLHTYTHTPENLDLYNNHFRLNYEFEATQRVFTDATGYKTHLFRMPYSGVDGQITFNNVVLALNAYERGYINFGATVDSVDWNAKRPGDLLRMIKGYDEKTAVVLMHDSGGNRENTVKALPAVIAHYRDSGYQFRNSDYLLLGVPPMEKVGIFENFVSKSTSIVIRLVGALPAFSKNLFLVGLVVFSFNSVMIAVLAVAHRMREKRQKFRVVNFEPKVTVLVPAYNEEKVIVASVKSILAQDYKNLEVLVVDDGSTDNTQAVLSRIIKDKRVRVMWQPNRGKSAALNNGFKESHGTIVVTVDADTKITKDTVTNIVRHFADRKVAAVAGNIKVANNVNLLTFLQSVEYQMAINLDRRAYDFISSFFVVPGAIGAWRRSTVINIGMFSEATLTEDAELGLRLKKNGYKLKYESKAIAYTEVPTEMGKLISQRFRWTFGTLQTLWLYKNMCFRPKNGFLGMVVLPYTLFVYLPTTIVAPLIELSIIPIALFVSMKLVVFSVFLILTGRIALFLLSAKLAGESLKPWVLMLPYRFTYQFLWYVVMNFAMYRAFRGNLIPWTKMNHFGDKRKKKINFGLLSLFLPHSSFKTIND